MRPSHTRGRERGMKRHSWIGWAAVALAGWGGAARAVDPPRASARATEATAPAAEATAPQAATAAPAHAAACARKRPGTGAARAGESRQGGAVALATLGGATLAY